MLWAWWVRHISLARAPQGDYPALLLVVIRDGFCLFYDAKTKKVNGLNGSGRSPEKLNINYVRQRGVTGRRIPFDDLNSVTVPGAFTHVVGGGGGSLPTSGCAGVWVDTVEAFGTLKVAEVLEPAIRLAEGGFVPFTLYTSTLTSLGFVSSVPVSELHSAAVGIGVVCHS